MNFYGLVYEQWTIFAIFAKCFTDENYIKFAASFEGQVDKISLQKLLFLFTKNQAKPEYDFVPYKYGCYSYSAHADLTSMVSKGF